MEKTRTFGGNVRNRRVTHPRVKARREAAKARQAESDKRTPEERLARLDAAFGKGKGAKKERAKLLAKIEAKLVRDPSDGVKKKKGVGK